MSKDPGPEYESNAMSSRNSTHVNENGGISGQTAERLDSGMLHDLVRDVQTKFHGKEGCICPRGEPPELEEIRDTADVSSRSIGDFIDHSVDVS
jgi:hypothetical protein